MRRTKIVATLGPATESPEMVRRVILAGADVIRLNQSHGDRRWHERVFRLVRRTAAELKKPVAILVDLQGPKVRIGRVAGGRIELRKNSIVDIKGGSALGDAGVLYTPLPQLVEDVKPGDRVLLDDGSIVLRVIARRGKAARCRVVVGGALGDHKGMNLPGVRLRIPSVTAKDLEDLKWAARSEADYVAVSFVRSARDIEPVRRALERLRSGIRIIAKIEKPEALRSLDAVARAVDGLMVARGDLGVEMDLEEVPVAQMRIIDVAHRLDIPVIVATQMLQSMTGSPRPTRAEVSDVAGAIFGGTDAVMLSGETAAGQYPIEAVREMASIAEHAESHMAESGEFEPRHSASMTRSVADAVCHGANLAGRDLAARAVFVGTATGRTALLFSKYRFPGVVVGGSDDPAAVRRMALYWGVSPVRVPKCRNTTLLFEAIVRASVERRYVSAGDLVVFIAGIPHGEAGATNLMRVHTIGSGRPGRDNGTRSKRRP